MTTKNQGKKRQEKVFSPAVARENKAGAASLEIAVDHLPSGIELRFMDELLGFTQERAEFKETAVLWQWFCPYSADFSEFGGPVAAEFVCMAGLPEECRIYVSGKRGNLLGKALRYPADPLTTKEIKDSRCLGYVEGGNVWQPLDAVRG